MASFKFHLGVHVTTKIELFKGCIVSRMDSITGCNLYCIQPEVGTDGKFIESIWCNEHNLEIDASKQQLKLYRDADQPPG